MSNEHWYCLVLEIQSRYEQYTEHHKSPALGVQTFRECARLCKSWVKCKHSLVVFEMSTRSRKG